MNAQDKEHCFYLREKAIARMDKSTPGEQAIVSMLMVISAQLESMDDSIEQLTAQFNRVSGGGNSLLTESA